MKDKNSITYQLARAIRSFISAEEVFDDKAIVEAAQEYVYNHDEWIRQMLREQINWDDIFDLVLEDAVEEAYSEYEPW
ncbi:MAG: hypothetical protein J6S49_09620 [Erysipelotrichaceae bacterium]|nr:hypothetical protein [Erysipelotrichaceae bacterium]